MIDYDKEGALLEGYGYGMTVAADERGAWGLRLEIDGESGGFSTATVEGRLRDLDRLVEALGKVRVKLDPEGSIEENRYDRLRRIHLQEIKTLRENQTAQRLEINRLAAELADALKNWEKEREEWRAEDPDRWDVDQLVKNLREREQALNARAVELERYDQLLEARSRQPRDAAATSHAPHTLTPESPPN